MARALIIGAGAIGRGFVPWVLSDMEVDFADASQRLVEGISTQSGFRTFMSRSGVMDVLHVRPGHVSSTLEDLPLQDYDFAIVSVGPRNVTRLPEALRDLTCPVFSLENDPGTVEVIRRRYGLTRVYFGVPDVIASSAASPEHLALDPFAVHTENGVLYLEDPGTSVEPLKQLLPAVIWLPRQRLNEEWDAKLYLHNMPHCIAAYLGHLAGCRYLHESMAVPAARRIVDGAIEEMLLALKLATKYDQRFMESYADKEIRRFSNDLLCDPISRVAREPLRKLQASGRLMGALRMMLFTGVRPVNLMLGIAGALMYDATIDEDGAKMKLLDEFGVTAFIQYHLGLGPDSLESKYITTHFDDARAHLMREFA